MPICVGTYFKEYRLSISVTYSSLFYKIAKAFSHYFHAYKDALDLELVTHIHYLYIHL